MSSVNNSEELTKKVKEYALKLDLDIKYKTEAEALLFDRLSYFNDIGFLNMNKINKIILVKKRTYGAKIYLNFTLKNINNQTMLESILGSDWRKGVNQLINKHKLNMEYSNRLFDIKRYKNGRIITAKHYDITAKFISYMLDPKRKVWKN